MLRLVDVDAFYGDSHILHGVSVEVARGERVAVVGRNGAGKSTLLKCIMNAGPAVKGPVELDGSPLGNLPAFRRARQGLYLVPEDRRIFGHLTVEENLELARKGSANAAQSPGVDAVIDQFPMLAPLRGRLGGRLSGGQQQMLAIARALVAAPSFLLLDEPTEGLAPVIVERLAMDVQAACDALGSSLLLCEQNLWFARQCTNRVYILDGGQVAFNGSWADFDGDASLKRRHLSM